MKIQEKRNMIRGIIKDSKSKFISVEFIKKDGSERKMRIQQSMVKLNLSDNVSDKQKQINEKRAKNNPHLLPVFDFDDNAIKSINLDTVVKLNSNGVEYRFKD